MFNRKNRSHKSPRLGSQNLEVETICIKEVKEKLLDHHVARLETFAQKTKELQRVIHQQGRKKKYIYWCDKRRLQNTCKNGQIA